MIAVCSPIAMLLADCLPGEQEASVGTDLLVERQFDVDQSLQLENVGGTQLLVFSHLKRTRNSTSVSVCLCV